jgi:hypothetical protein
VHSANRTSKATIFARVWESDQGKLPRTVARHILKLGFPKEDQGRMHELAAKNQEGRITAEELEELDNYVTIGDLLALLQSQARRTLKKTKRGSLRNE